MLSDLRSSLRAFVRQPGFMLAAVATLAVGIGATTAIFSTVNATLLRPLPYPHPEDLFAVYTPATDGRFTTGRCSGVELARLNTPSVSIVHAAGASRLDTTILMQDGTALAATGFGVTEGYFDIFNLPMTAGRAFTQADHARGSTPIVIISYRFWRDFFGSDPAVIGKSIRFSTGAPVPQEIVGVASRDFDMPHGADFWLNFVIGPQSTGHGFDGFLRVKPGTRREELQAQMASVMAGIAQDYGNLGKNRRYDLQPLVSAIVGDLGATLAVVLGAAVLLLLLACVNVTNLMLARGTVRAREMAVRVALGASRRRIVGQLLLESLLLSAAGTAVGLLLAYVGVRLVSSVGAASLPRLDDIPFDGRVLGFALASMLLTALVVGFAPALRLAGTSLKGLMNESGRSATPGHTAHRLLKGLVVAEIALAIIIVAGAGWLAQSFANLGRTNLGFTPRGRVVFDMLLPPLRIFNANGPTEPAVAAERFAVWRRGIDERLRAIGGITDVAATSTLPFGVDRDAVLYVGVQGAAIDPEHPQVARAHRVSAEFFRTMGVRLLAGRSFSPDDRGNTAPVAIVNQTFVNRYLGGRDPLTAKFTAGYPDVPAAPVITIVGVVDDVKYVSPALAADPAYYQPDTQSFFIAHSFIVGTSLADPKTLLTSIRDAMRAAEPQIPTTPRLLSDVVATTLVRQRLGMTLMLAFAAAALALAAVGIYGVIAYVSAQRAGEVATRMALGATPSDAFWLLMRQGRTLALAGVGLGAVLAYASGRAGSSLLYEVRASDPLVLLGAMAVVMSITMLAILMPARRAARIEPSRVLRSE